MYLKVLFSEPKEFITYTQDEYTSSKLLVKTIDQCAECCAKQWRHQNDVSCCGVEIILHLNHTHFTKM